MKDEAFDPFSLPALAAWRQPFDPPPSVSDYVYRHVSVTDAVALASVFAPRFVDVQGCLLVAENYEPENLRTWLAQLEGRAQDVERMINHQSLWDLLPPAGEDEERALEQVALVMADAWRAAAQRQFPHLQVRTDVVDDYGPTVLLWTDRG
ncbi:hypothetical protein [Kineococcus rhizosphaerae]|uniref:Uncharacterized protein n=1 Tax=Kineococcus rhizosphaerae TaxID=559628 RepID=A0A2T0R4J2_9ACTN|nr:hypothetical protein [Kineococcus rhizosphaerae]PRY15249.1 hypothetical protein CLV37_105176 [Kineococcus rhizosphaerae]